MTSLLDLGVVVRARRRMRWRSRVAAFVLVAVAWPSLGPLPWIVEPWAIHEATAHLHESALAHEANGPAHDEDTAPPGSPLHPVDHDCFACQLLANLARCAPLPIALAVVAAVAACPAPQHPRGAPRAEVFVALTPPARAPPPPAS